MGADTQVEATRGPAMTEHEFEELHAVRCRLERLTFERTHRSWSERKSRAYTLLAARELELIRGAESRDPRDRAGFSFRR
jgi:hypothetical protein